MANKKTPSYSDIQNDGIAAKGLKKIKGERLKKELKRAGFTHAVFAERVGYTAKYISEICSGNRQIPDNYIPSAAEIINERLRKQGDFVFPEYLAGKVDYRNENERLEQLRSEFRIGIDETKQKKEFSKAFQSILAASGYSIRSCTIPDWAGMLKTISAIHDDNTAEMLCNIDKYSSQSEWVSGENPKPLEMAMLVEFASLIDPAGIVYYVKTPLGELKTVTHAELMHMYESAKTILGALFAGIIDRPGNSCNIPDSELTPIANFSDIFGLSDVLGSPDNWE